MPIAIVGSSLGLTHMSFADVLPSLRDCASAVWDSRWIDKQGKLGPTTLTRCASSWRNVKRRASAVTFKLNNTSTVALQVAPLEQQSKMAMELDGEDDEQIKAQVEEWASNSNDCFTINIVRGDGTTAASFQPDFTNLFFTDEESIFGYQDLSINLSFAAHNLRPHLSIKYKKKFKAQGDVKATDITEVLQDFLPTAAFSGEDTSKALLDERAASFVPPGEQKHSYKRDDSYYEIWCANLSDPAAKELLENMQVLVPMFIEGGTMLQLEQDWTTQRWKLFLLYEVLPSKEADPTYSPYSLIGYGTSYRIFTLPDRQSPTQSDLDLFTAESQSLENFLPPPQTAFNDLASKPVPKDITSPLDLPSRERLSQFLILPPFQGSGHGQQLYNTMFTHLTAPANVKEFTIEDPNEAFDDLRDFCDLLDLRTHVPDFAALRINIQIPADKLQSRTNIPTDLIVPLATREKIMRETKIMQRQFDRLVEMHTLSFIPTLNRSRSRITRKEKASNEHDRAYYFWRLYAKQRLYIFNRDQLVQVEREERIEKLESALDSVQEAYAKVIEKVEEREKDRHANGSPLAAAAGASEGTPRKRLGKRKVVEKDDDDDDDGDQDAGNTNGVGQEMGDKGIAVNGHKKARVE